MANVSLALIPDRMEGQGIIAVEPDDELGYQVLQQGGGWGYMLTHIHLADKQRQKKITNKSTF